MLQRQARGASVIGLPLPPTWCIIRDVDMHTHTRRDGSIMEQVTCAAMKQQAS